MDRELLELAHSLGEALEKYNMKLVTAESCTGGWISKCVTDVPGSSAWLDRAFITYSNEAKTEMLQIPSGLIEQHGAVSLQVVEAMTAGALANSHGDLAVAVSGVAGPDGGSAEKPVGTVWICWQQRGEEPQSSCFNFDGDREQIRFQTVEKALSGLLEII